MVSGMTTHFDDMRTRRIAEAVNEVIRLGTRNYSEEDFNRICERYSVNPNIVELIITGNASAIKTQKKRVYDHIIKNRSITSKTMRAKYGSLRHDKIIAEICTKKGIKCNRREINGQNGQIYVRYELIKQPKQTK